MLHPLDGTVVPFLRENVLSGFFLILNISIEDDNGTVKVRRVTVVFTLIFISLWGGGCASGPGGGAGQNQPYKIACRLANYGPDNQDAGLQHIRDLGLHYVFMSIRNRKRWRQPNRS